MAEGNLKCCGSPIFLKKRFGAGYHLRVAKGEFYNAPLVEHTIRKHLPDAHMQSEIQSEVIYALEKFEAAGMGMRRFSCDENDPNNADKVVPASLTTKFPDL